MEINLNLLSPLKKNKINSLVNFIFIRNLLEFTVFTAAIISIFLLWSWVTLVDQFENLSQSAISVNKEYGGYNQEIRMINKINKDIMLASRGYVSTSPKLFGLIELTPDDITLSAIDFERDTQNLTISGTAKTRDSLLNYVEMIKTTSWLDQVVAPTSQLFQKENINFEIEAKIKITPLKTPQKTSPGAASGALN